jgi:hypothetical protein
VLALEPAPGFHVPSLTRRLIVGVLIGIGLFVVLVIVPLQVLARLSNLPVGFTTQVPLGAIELSGTIIAVLYAARSVLRPTRAFGPVSVAGSLFSLLYLLYLAPLASVGVGVDRIGVALVFGGLLTLLAVVPLLGMCAGVVATVEDFARPGERVRYEYRAAY